MRDRGRGAHHPLQLALVVALLTIGVSQLNSPVQQIQSTPITSLPDSVQRTFAGLLVLAAGLVLAGAVLPEPRAYWLELGGHVGAAAALTVYTLTLKTTVPQWTTSMGAGFGCVAVGCYLRIAWLTVLVIANFYPRLGARLARVYVSARLAFRFSLLVVRVRWRLVRARLRR